MANALRVFVTLTLMLSVGAVGLPDASAEDVGIVGTSTDVTTDPADSVAVGLPVQLTASVTPDSGTTAPTGTVTFKENGVAIGAPVAVTPSEPDSSVGAARLTLPGASLWVGSHAFTAQYVPATGSLFSGSVGTATLLVTGDALTATIGQTGYKPNPASWSCGSPGSYVQVSTGGEPAYVVPAGMNRIVSWSTQSAGLSWAQGPVGLMVWRYMASSSTVNYYQLMATSPLQPVPLAQVYSFTLTPTIAVQPGDVLGLYHSGQNHCYMEGLSGDSFASLGIWPPSVGSGYGFRTAYPYTKPGRLNMQVLLANIQTSVATTTSLTTAPTSSVYGQPVTLNATVTPASGSNAPTGTVLFRDGGAPVGDAVSVAPSTPGSSVGLASLRLPSGTLTRSSHTLTAEYSPSTGSVFLGSSGSTTHVVAKADTTTTVAPAGPLTLTDPATQAFTATVAPVAPGAGTSTGSVQFQVDYADDAPDAGYVNVGPAVPLAAGIAESAISLSVTNAGTHAVRAVYAGDDNFTGSPAPAVQVTVDKATTTTTLTSSVNPSVYSQPVTFTATVARAEGMPPGGVPAGSVVFKEGTAVLGEVALDSDGVATLTTSDLTSVAHVITAEFVPAVGSPVIGSSDVLTQTVTRASLTSTLTPAGPLSLVYPAIQEYTVSVSLDAPATRFPSELTAVFSVQLDGGVWTAPVEPPGVSFNGASASFTFALPVNAAGQQHYVQSLVRAMAPGERGNYDSSPSNVVTVSVDRAPLTVTADDQTMTYGGPVPDYDATVQGLVAPDTFVGLGGSCSAAVGDVPVTAATPAGTYPDAITCSGVDEANYAVTYVAGDLTVQPKALTITAQGQRVQYSDPLPELTVAYDGFVLDEGPEVLDGTLACDTAATVTGGQVLSPAGTYPITCGGLTADNYAITFEAGTLTVTPEDTVVRLAQSNPHAVAVIGKKTPTAELTFTARIMGAPDGFYGNITEASPVTLTLAPVSDGGPITVECSVDRVQPATATDPGFELVACTVGAGTPINVYQVDLTVGGDHYHGRDTSVLTVYDPTAGGTTGAGVVTNPNTDNLAEVAYSAAYLKNGKTVQGRFLYVSRDGDGAVVHVLKGNVMSTLAITGTTGMVTGKATLDGVGNYTYILTGIDNRTLTDANPPGEPDRYGQHVLDGAGAAFTDLTFAPVEVGDGNIYVGK